MLDSRARKYVQPFFSLLARLLIGMGATPNMLTLAALCTGMASAGAFFSEGDGRRSRCFGFPAFWTSSTDRSHVSGAGCLRSAP